MALSFSAVEAFYWASQLRSFNAAAEKLSITQPTVSYRIKELEEQLGVPLFIRQKRQLQLTSEGEALKHYAEAMIGIARDIESNIKTRNTRLPTLRVGVMDSFAANRAAWQRIGQRGAGYRERLRWKRGLGLFYARPQIAAHGLGDRMLRFAVIDCDPDMLLKAGLGVDNQTTGHHG